MKEETLRIWNADGLEHYVHVRFTCGEDRACLDAYYMSGSNDIEKAALIANWCASYEPKNKHDPGQATLGDGRIDIEVDALRGIGLGSLLMRPLIIWIRNHSEPVPLMPINLAGDDAKTESDRNIRNKFYEKLGFSFDYKDNKKWGESRPMSSSKLVVPKFRLSREWRVESIEGEGQVFSRS